MTLERWAAILREMRAYNGPILLCKSLRGM